MQHDVLWGISQRFHRLCPSHGYVAHALRTLSPVAGRVLLLPAAPRLACVKPAASVHPEPGSNSSLYIQKFLVRSWQSVSKKLTLSYNFLGTCLYYSFIIVKELIVFPILLANGIAKVRTFSFSPNFFSLFFAFFQKKARNCIIKGVFS